MEKVLNVAGGKFPPLNLTPPYFSVNVDTMYYYNRDPAEVEKLWSRWDKKTNKVHNVKADVFEFLERTYTYYHRVCIYRFLEHVSFTNVLYFIYLIAGVTEKNSKVDVIVPNYSTLATMILEEDPRSPIFEEENILLTTELLNEPSCPHASIWTVDRAYHFWEMEGRFKVENVQPSFRFDGREIYLRFQARRL